jgi:hypothetical protein
MDKDVNDKHITDANHQGNSLAQKIVGQGIGNGALDGTLIKRDTNWREHVKEWLASVCEGDEYSKYSPPEQVTCHPQGFIMPLFLPQATLLAIHQVYEWVRSGSVRRDCMCICQNLNPDSVRILWVGYVVGEKASSLSDDHKLGSLMKPVGGGGTRVTCVAEDTQFNKYKPKGVIYLTDGYIEFYIAYPNFLCYSVQ